MRITIISLDSRGDVQPCIALGLGLHAAGHNVRLATHPEHAGLIPAGTLELAPVVQNPRGQLESGGRAMRDATRNRIAFTRRLIRTYGTLMARYMAECRRACEGADAIMFSASAFFARSIAEQMHIPFFPVFLQPVSPTSAFPHSLFGAGLRLRGPYNRLTYSVAGQLSRQLWRPAVNLARHEALGMGPIPLLEYPEPLHRRGQPFLYGFSPAVVPKPRDWGAWVHVTGYWFLDRPCQWQAPADLLAFLDAEPKPIYVGFGSMNKNDRRPEDLAATVRAALARVGRRGILALGGEPSGIGRDGNVFIVDAVPHDWLFPRVAVAVHHGGAGTTAAALRAGIPSAIVPYFADQPFWARRAFDLGVAPAPIPRRRLSVERLADAISLAATSQDMTARAGVLGARIRAEDGVACAVDAFHHHIR